MRRSVFVRRAVAATWKELRADVVSEVCVGRTSGRPEPRSHLALLRREASLQARLDDFIADARLAASAQAGQELPAGRLASLLDLRGDHEEALDVLTTDARMRSPSASMRFLHEVVSRHAAFATERERRMKESASGAPGALAGGATSPVAVVEGDLTAEEFAARFAVPGVPCVFRCTQSGGTSSSSAMPRWSPEELCQRIGTRKVPLLSHKMGSATWARMELSGAMTYAEFVKNYVDKDNEERAPTDDLQLFDFSVWQNLSRELGQDVLIPKWFCTDLYSWASARVQPVTGSASPTLFTAAAGTSSSLHVDFLQTHFWMGMCHGRKRWRVIPPADLPLLYPSYLADLNPLFPFDLDECAKRSLQAPEEHPALAQVTVQEVVLEPGDVIFIPAGAPHQVANLETSVALSANFIDRSNIQRSRREAGCLGLVQEDPQLFADVLADVDVQGGTLERLEATAPTSHLPLRTFKERHGEKRAPQETQRFIAAMLLGSVIGIAAAAFAAVRWTRAAA
eukprot:TRINITY_DN29870_c0_g2_i1.p1 TRINITY_DN29870_c0_g2~~TRINITY_DN29870_c0_g2_i1.p1  ORF type:complete len:511 (-),score=98.90 TRINITY_DN29870_c0_g2_i1:214-1746(-)